MTPTISAIVPVFNGAAYLADTLRSILSQTVPATEVIVVDDGSTDESAAVAQSFSGVTYLHQPHAGGNAARNRGVIHSCGEYLAFLDHDDLWLPEKLALQLQAFRQNPELDLVYGHAEQFQSPELAPHEQAGFSTASRATAGIHVGTLLARRASFLRVGLFREDLAYAEFVEWYALASELHLRQHVVPETVMRRRIHRNNMTLHGGRQSKQAFARTLKAVLDRRRAAAGVASYDPVDNTRSL